MGYRSKHPGINTTLTIGGGVEPGETLEAALEKTRRATLEWSTHRGPLPGDPGMRERVRTDLDAQIAHLERHGLLIISSTWTDRSMLYARGRTLSWRDRKPL